MTIERILSELNAAINKMQAEIRDLTEKLEYDRDAFLELHEELDMAIDNVANLEAHVARLESENDDLRAEIKRLEMDQSGIAI